MKKMAMLVLLAAGIIGTALADDAPARHNNEPQTRAAVNWHHAAGDPGQCYADCDDERNICTGQCQGDYQCINNCTAAHTRCMNRCY